MCQRWGKPEDWKITPRGCYTLRQQHGRIICRHNCYVGSKRASLSGNKHLLTSNEKKINENTKLEYIQRSEVSAGRLSWIRFQKTLAQFLAEPLVSKLPVFLLCASISPPVKWGQWYWFDVRSTGEKSYIRAGTIIIFPHPNTSCDAFFSNILSHKENTILFTECRSVWKHFMTAFLQRDPKH